MSPSVSDRSGYRPVNKAFAVPMAIGSIIANNTEYLSFDCANEEIEKEKIVFPFLGIAVIFLFVYVIYKKEIHKKLKDY